MEKESKEFITSLDSLTTEQLKEYSKKSTGVITGLGNYTGEQIVDLATATFGNVNSITPDQLSYLLSFLMPSSYILKNHRIKNGKQRFTFSVPNYGDNDPAKALSHRPWQYQIVNDVYNDVVVRKSRQLGLSELAVAFMLWWTDVHSQDGVNALYAFPTYRQMNDFVKMRLNPVLESVPYFRGIIDDKVNSIDLKRIRNSQITFRTSSKPGALEGVNADAVFLDEYDHVTPAALQSAIGSLSSSKFKLMRRFSTPTAPDIGIDDLYKHSDMMHYLHKCTHCGQWNLMDYSDYVDDGNPVNGGNLRLINPDGVDLLSRTITPGTYQFVCSKCGKELDRWYSGLWVPEKPQVTMNGGTRGYHISKMNAVFVTADRLKAAELNAKSKQAFYNYELGEPFSDIKLQVVDSDIKDHATFENRRTSRNGYPLVVAGVDWGQQHHTISVLGMRSDGEYELLTAFQVDAVSSTDSAMSGTDIASIIRDLYPFNPDMVICDVGDSGSNIHALMNYYGKDKVFGAVYSSNPTSGLYTATNKFEATWNVNTNSVSMDKLTQNKKFISMMKQGKIGFWEKDDANLEMFIQHCKNVVIRDEEQSNGDFRQVITRRGGDHSMQAAVIALVGMEKLREERYDKSSYDVSITDLDVQPEKTDLAARVQATQNGNVDTRNLFD